jgi:predicted metalloprotease
MTGVRAPRAAIAAAVRRAPALLVALVLAVGAAGTTGCGKEELGQLAKETRTKAEQRLERLRARVEEVLGRLQAAVPRARRTSPDVRSRGRTQPTTIDVFLTDVLRSVDRFWTRTLAANGLPEPRVAFRWVPPGAREPTGCGTAADDAAAFYCPSDDTIYVAEVFASRLYEGTLTGLPGEQAGFGRAAGDFGVAYVVAHEYGHNLQTELGLFRIARTNSSEPFELQADCLAGAWGRSVYAEGHLGDADIAEAVDTAEAVGDFDFTSANHHGTPEQRADAWLTGFRGSDPSTCGQFVPTAT